MVMCWAGYVVLLYLRFGISIVSSQRQINWVKEQFLFIAGVVQRISGRICYVFKLYSRSAIR